MLILSVLGWKWCSYSISWGIPERVQNDWFPCDRGYLTRIGGGGGALCISHIHLCYVSKYAYIYRYVSICIF